MSLLVNILRERKVLDTFTAPELCEAVAQQKVVPTDQAYTDAHPQPVAVEVLMRRLDLEYAGALGLGKIVEAGTMKRAYRRLVIECHPDKVSKDKEAQATLWFRTIQDAYEYLRARLKHASSLNLLPQVDEPVKKDGPKPAPVRKNPTDTPRQQPQAPSPKKPVYRPPQPAKPAVFQRGRHHGLWRYVALAALVLVAGWQLPGLIRLLGLRSELTPQSVAVVQADLTETELMAVQPQNVFTHNFPDANVNIAPISQTNAERESALALITRLGGVITLDNQSTESPKPVITISFSDTKISSAELLQLGCLTRLLSFNNNGCPEVTDEGMAAFANMRELKFLMLWSVGSITDAGLQKLEGLIQLINLNIGGNGGGITGSGLSHLRAMKNLQSLTLNCLFNLDGKHLEHIASLSNLERLSVARCPKISDIDLDYLANLRRLKNLNLDGTQVSDLGLKKIKHLDSLREIELRGTKVTASGITDLQTAIPGLKVLIDSELVDDGSVPKSAATPPQAIRTLAGTGVKLPNPAALTFDLSIIEALAFTLKERQWSDIRGRKIDAGYAGMEGADKVLLRTQAGTVTSYPVKDLSQQDQEFAREVQTNVGHSMKMMLPGNVALSWRYCPPGVFTMGSPKNEAERGGDEDQVLVCLSQGFWMAQTELTQLQWIALMSNNPSNFKGDELPVECVNWEDAQDFISKLSQTVPLPTGWQYALPTEAQWEYACRAGTQSVFHFGEALISDQANFDGSYPFGTIIKGPYLKSTTVAGRYQANAWGLHDMHGSVWEWCADWYSDKLTGGEDVHIFGGAKLRVIRGGSWNDIGGTCRSASRSKEYHGIRSICIGFRPILAPIKK